MTQHIHFFPTIHNAPKKIGGGKQSVLYKDGGTGVSRLLIASCNPAMHLVHAYKDRRGATMPSVLQQL